MPLLKLISPTAIITFIPRQINKFHHFYTRRVVPTNFYHTANKICRDSPRVSVPAAAERLLLGEKPFFVPCRCIHRTLIRNFAGGQRPPACLISLSFLKPPRCGWADRTGIQFFRPAEHWRYSSDDRSALALRSSNRPYS